MTQLQTNMALEENLQKKETFNSLIASDLLSNDEHVDEIIVLDKDKDGIFGFFKLSNEIIIEYILIAQSMLIRFQFN